MRHSAGTGRQTAVDLAGGVPSPTRDYAIHNLGAEKRSAARMAGQTKALDLVQIELI